MTLSMRDDTELETDDILELQTQIEERFQLLKQIESYFGEHPKPEKTILPSHSLLSEPDYGDDIITFPKECLTSEQRQSYTNQYIKDLSQEKQKQYEKACQEYEQACHVYQELKDNYENYEKQFNQAFPMTQQERTDSESNRLENVYEIIHTGIYRKVNSIIYPERLPIKNLHDTYGENVIDLLAKNMKDYSSEAANDAYKMAQFLFPKIDIKLGMVFVERLHPGKDREADDFSPTASKMILSIAKQNSDNIPFLMHIYEKMYWGGCCPFHGENGEDTAKKIIDLCCQKDEDGHVVQEITGHEELVESDKYTTPFLLMRHEYGENTKTTRARTINFSDLAFHYLYDEVPYANADVETPDVIYHETNGKEDTNIYLAQQRIAEQKEKKLAKLLDKPNLQKVVGKIVNTKVFNDIALAVAKKKIKKSRGE